MKLCVCLNFIIAPLKDLYYVDFLPKHHALSLLALLWAKHLFDIVYSVVVTDCHEEQ